MKKTYFLLGVVILILLAALILRLTSPEDDWICENGGWLKHGNPSAAMPTESCVKEQPRVNNPENNISASSTTTGEASFSTDALVLSPKRDELISSPLKIQGRAVGSWFFEAVLPVRLEDNSGNVIASGQALAEEDWMTVKPINFSASLDFSLASTTATSGYLILSKDNPSGLAENSGFIKVPVRFR